MKLRSKLAMACLSVLLAGAFANQARAADQPFWWTDFKAAEAAAKQSQRPLLIHFHAAWCGPCRQMESQVLNSSELRQFGTDRLVAVKVDIDEHPELGQRFKVRALPNDVIVSPDGKVLHSMEGFQSKQAYIASVARVEARFHDQPRGKRIARAAVPPIAAPTTPAAPPAAQEPAVAAAPKPRQELTSATKMSATPTIQLDQSELSVGLDGYCPVTLWKSRAWIKGREDLTFEHQGVTFRFQSPQALAEFRAEPGRYAPQLLGCDAVLLSDTDRAITGSSRFGAYYDGELYLFDSSETRARFRANPPQYTQTRHVLRVGASARN